MLYFSPEPAHNKPFDSKEDYKDFTKGQLKSYLGHLCSRAGNNDETKAVVDELLSHSSAEEPVTIPETFTHDHVLRVLHHGVEVGHIELKHVEAVAEHLLRDPEEESEPRPATPDSGAELSRPGSAQLTESSTDDICIAIRGRDCPTLDAIREMAESNQWAALTSTALVLDTTSSSDASVSTDLVVPPTSEKHTPLTYFDLESLVKAIYPNIAPHQVSAITDALSEKFKLEGVLPSIFREFSKEVKIQAQVLALPSALVTPVVSITIRGGNIQVPQEVGFTDLEHASVVDEIPMGYRDDSIKRKITSEEYASFLKNIFDTLKEMHANGFSHGNVTSQNIIIAPSKLQENTLEALLGDFSGAQSDFRIRMGQVVSNPQLDISARQGIKTPFTEYYGAVFSFAKALLPFNSDVIEKIGRSGQMETIGGRIVGSISKKSAIEMTIRNLVAANDPEHEEILTSIFRNSDTEVEIDGKLAELLVNDPTNTVLLKLKKKWMLSKFMIDLVVEMNSASQNIFDIIPKNIRDIKDKLSSQELAIRKGAWKELETLYAPALKKFEELGPLLEAIKNIGKVSEA